ncbi:VWA domain-containing protein [Antarcticibacterium flavum]|uniref:VWA domain-containing protein n=1 Tax=Antarcticibacterium flavum TaxID=2058175 RepID=A0A5B7WYH6_9FLAO|nr:VWA domain-containing protein [Antarcticibacterium sp. W02-3]QCY68226.1 VWA domain-containing protein [Antarcticibacterium flavum]
MRFISVFVLLLLLINPEIKQKEYELEKQQLFLAYDLSGSMKYLETKEEVIALAEELRGNGELRDKFDIREFGFGRSLVSLQQDSMEFNENQTNIRVALDQLEKLRSSQRAAVVMVTDGNQTIGEDYQYYRPGPRVDLFPLVAGDTTARVDLAINNLNVNRYAFLNNRFPVEIILSYTGSEAVTSSMKIKLGETVLFSQQVNFSAENTSEVITTTLPASSLGLKVYEAEITPLDSEKNTANNTRSFGVEVIDERTSVLILTSILHPDLGAVKKSIEANEQRQAEIINIKDVDNVDINDFQLVVLYQPNNNFNRIISRLREQGINYFLITGTKTDWNFIASVMPFGKDFTTQSQDYLPVYNANYSRFQFEDIGFKSLPPLQDVFGNIEFENANQSVLLYQQIEGVSTTTPLLATLEENSSRYATLFGENIWRWRSQSYADSGSFEDFDNFFGKLVQYLSSTQRRERLTIDAGNFYAENEEVLVTARYFDENYEFNPGGQLEIQLRNVTSQEELESQMLLNNNRFTFRVDDLAPGEYEFEVQEMTSGISRGGNFTVIAYNVEEQFGAANISKLRTFAGTAGSDLYYLDNYRALITELLEDNRYLPVQKSREKAVPLISWKFLLILLILSLSAEWFTRKYFGLI